jgi:hypothetical protein
MERMNNFAFFLFGVCALHLFVGLLVVAEVKWKSIDIATVAYGLDVRNAMAASQPGQEESKRTGQMPLWTPYFFSGMPGFSSGMTTGVPGVHPLNQFWIYIPKFIGFILYNHTLLFDILVLSIIGLWYKLRST